MIQSPETYKISCPDIWYCQRKHLEVVINQTKQKLGRIRCYVVYNKSEISLAEKSDNFGVIYVCRTSTYRERKVVVNIFNRVKTTGGGRWQSRNV